MIWICVYRAQDLCNIGMNDNFFFRDSWNSTIASYLLVMDCAGASIFAKKSESSRNTLISGGRFSDLDGFSFFFLRFFVGPSLSLSSIVRVKYAIYLVF